MLRQRLLAKLRPDHDFAQLRELISERGAGDLTIAGTRRLITDKVLPLAKAVIMQGGRTGQQRAGNPRVKRKQGYDLHLAQQYLAESELRVAWQEQLITTLKNQGRSTDQAKRILKNFEMTVVKLRNTCKSCKLS